MGDFSLSEEKIAKINREIEELRQREAQREVQKDYQRMLLKTGKSSEDVRELELATATEKRKAEINCEQDAWKKIQKNAGMVNLVVPEDAAIGSPVQQEPAESEKQRKDRLKKLDKIDKENYGYVSYRSVVLQEKANANRVSREAIENQIAKDRKKGIDEKTLKKEEAKQNLIRAFSHDVRTDKLGKPIKEDEEKAKSNEAYKNNMEGHMSGVVQWVYQVDLNPQKLNDAYVQGHCTELLQTAERLKAFFDYYKLMGDEEWERGFLNDGAIMGVSGKEILEIKVKQAEIFRNLLSDKFKTVLSVDMETGEFLTDDDRTAFAANLSASNQTRKRAELQSEYNSEKIYYQRMVKDAFDKEPYDRILAEGNRAQEEVFEEHEKNAERYAKLSEMLNSDNAELKKYENFAEHIRAQVERDKRNFNRVYVSLEKYLQLNYANQTVLGKKLQGIVDQERKELQEERRQLNERLQSFEEPIRFIVEGGKISSPTTVDTLVKAGYPADLLLERAYRSKGGILDQSNEILNELEVRQKEDGEDESPKEYEDRLIMQSSIVTRRVIQRVNRVVKLGDNSNQQPTDDERKEVLQELTDAERKQALEEVRTSINDQAVKLLLGRGKVGEELCRLAAKSVNFDFKERYAGNMEIFVRHTIHSDLFYKQSPTFKNDGTSFDIYYGNGGRGKELQKTGESKGRFTYHPVNVDNVLELKEKGNLEQDSDRNFVGAGMDQATLDYVNYIDILGLYDTEGSGGKNSVMRYFDRMKELIGDAKFFQVKDEKGEVDEKKTNRKFTAFLLQDYSNHNTASVPLAVKKTEGQYTKSAEKQMTIFTMIASSLMDIAKKDTTGENYKEGSTMQEALVTYRKMADRVAGELEKREAEKKEKEVKEQKPAAKKTAEAAKKHAEERNRKKTTAKETAKAAKEYVEERNRKKTTAKETAEAAKEYVEERNRKKTTAKETAEAAKEYVEKNKKEKAAKKAAEEAKKQAPEEKKAEETV